MTKIELPYLFAPKAKGKTYYYYRRHGQRIAIKGKQGHHITPKDPGFASAWEAIHTTFEGKAATATATGSLAHLIDTYRVSPDFKQLTPSTRKQYTRYLNKLKEHYGNLSVSTMPREFVLGLRDKYSDTPRAANYLIQVLRLVLSYAEDRQRTFRLPNGWSNPARHPKLLKTGDGHRPWEEYELSAFRNTWALGTLERTAFELLLNTGQRGGDVVKMARRHLNSDNTISVSQEKTNERLDIPLSNALRESLDAWKKNNDHLIILVNEYGKPLTSDAYQKIMLNARTEARLNTTNHGLRYTAATILSELGCDFPTIAAITGHQTAEMVRKYTAKKRRARIAIDRLNNARKE